MKSRTVNDTADSPTLARRMGNFATNVLVSGVIIIIGLAFGREVLSWWGTQSATDSSPNKSMHVVEPPNGLDQPLVEFGDFPFQLNRRDFVGDAAGVTEQLRMDCRRAIEHSQPLLVGRSAAEERMLAAAQRIPPIREQSGAWSIHQIHVPLPMVVGVRTFASQVAAADRRVVCWGLAIPDATPEGEQQSEWTLLTYSSSASIENPPAGLTLPAPPGGKRTLSLRTDQGDAVIGYAGSGTVASWSKFYEELFADSSPSISNEWEIASGTWRQRFVTTDDETIETETVDVIISSDSEHRIRSLVIASPTEHRSK